MNDMSKATTGTARDVRAITEANRAQSASAAQISSQLAAIRSVAEQNVEGVRRTRDGTVDLLKLADAISSGVAGARNGNGASRTR
jgi:methyl-accepting chemotaxis protein